MVNSPLYRRFYVDDRERGKICDCDGGQLVQLRQKEVLLDTNATFWTATATPVRPATIR